jgi:hypothetical protein
MTTYDDLLAELGEPVSFPPEAFVGDDRVPQDVCNFVLVLALVFNDLKDLILAHKLIQTIYPGEGPPNAARGQHGGLHVHFIRMLAGILNELAVVIQKNRKILTHPAFKALLKKTPAPARRLWENVVVNATATQAKGDRFGRLIFFARQKVVFHYDLKEIGRSYRLRFLSTTLGPPFISAGRNMAATRYYFADAAAEMYMMDQADAKTGKEFFSLGWKVLPEIGHALREVVTAFVNARGTPTA